MSSSPAPITTHIDAAPLKGLLLRVPVLCALMMTIEGMDSNAISYVGPMLSRDYGIDQGALGAIYTGTVVASLMGAILIAPLSDRFGRRWILILSSLVLGVATMVTPLASGFVHLFALRFIVGLAFGAAVPCAFALTADYAPARRRSVLLMTMVSGVALGHVVAGFAAAFIIPALGWRALMYIVGGVSLLWTVVLTVGLPESISFLMLRRPQSNTTAKLLGVLGFQASQILPPSPILQSEKPNPLVLFKEGRAPLSVVLLVVVTAVYGVELFLAYWLPTMLMNAGADIKNASLLTAVSKMASICGGILVGWWMDRRGARSALSKTFAMAATAIVVLGLVTGDVLPAVMVVVMSFFVDGSFAGTQAVTAGAYPSAVRATATGWLTGLGRLIGGGAGTGLGGVLIAAGWTTSEMTYLLAGTMLVGAGGMVLLTFMQRSVARGPNSEAPASASSADLAT